SQSTLGRFSKSTGRLVNSSVKEERNSQTLPRHLTRQEPPTRLEKNNKSNSTINVSIINTVSTPRKLEGPAKPVRTYKSNLSRSKSLNVHGGLDLNRSSVYTSNPQMHRLEENPIGLKSPGLISSLNRSQKDVSEDVYTTRFVRNGTSDSVDNKRVFLSSLKNRSPELFKTLEENDIIRRGSTSSTDFSETYHTTTRNGDPLHPSVTNTTKSFSKKTIPSKNGRGVQTIESSETKSITKSHYRSGSNGTF
ncbi:hypothetical protein NQ317_015728, partial [Molorchus minor]